MSKLLKIVTIGGAASFCKRNHWFIKLHLLFKESIINNAQVNIAVFFGELRYKYSTFL